MNVHLITAQSACSQADMDLLIEASEFVADVPGDIVELGCYKGASAMAFAIAHPRKMIYSCDLFGGNPYPERRLLECLGDVDFDEIRKDTQKFPNIVLVKGMHEQTVPLLPVKQVAFLFMDSDWYESHEVGLKVLAPKIPKGGIIAFHDWAFPWVRQAAIDVLHEGWEFLEGKFEFSENQQSIAFLRRIDGEAIR